MKFKTHNLICKFCGKQTGEYKYPDNLTVADLGIADVRCGSCEKVKGTYKAELVAIEIAKQELKLGSKTRKIKKKVV